MTLVRYASPRLIYHAPEGRRQLLWHERLVAAWLLNVASSAIGTIHVRLSSLAQRPIASQRPSC